MKEVEILVKVFDSKEKVLEALKKFEFKGIKKIRDVYFLNQSAKEMQVSKNKCPRKWFRVRKKDDKCYFCLKEDNFDENGAWRYSDEYETEVKDFEILIQIIEKLGFERLVEINNLKHTYETKEYELVFEDVKDLGFFLEIEKLKVRDNEDITQIKKEMQEFINDLKIKVSPELSIGKVEMMINKVGKSKKIK